MSQTTIMHETLVPSYESEPSRVVISDQFDYMIGVSIRIYGEECDVRINQSSLPGYIINIERVLSPLDSLISHRVSDTSDRHRQLIFMSLDEQTYILTIVTGKAQFSVSWSATMHRSQAEHFLHVLQDSILQ